MTRDISFYAYRRYKHGSQTPRSAYALAVASLLLLIGCSDVFFAQAITISQRRLSPTFTLTYVHGDKDAMKTHIEALQFCRSLGAPQANAEIAYTEEGAAAEQDNTRTTATNSTTTSTSSSTLPPPATTAPGTGIKSTIDNGHKAGHTITDSSGTRYRSDLLSVHDGHMVNELMKWVLGIDKRQFWIGGLVKLIEDDFREGETRQHLIQMWTDRTPANFRFLHFDNPGLRSLNLGNVACLSVDFASGKWGAHSCDTPMYFVCETVKLDKLTGEGENGNEVDNTITATQMPTTQTSATETTVPGATTTHTFITTTPTTTTAGVKAAAAVLPGPTTTTGPANEPTTFTTSTTTKAH